MFVCVTYLLCYQHIQNIFLFKEEIKLSQTYSCCGKLVSFLVRYIYSLTISIQRFSPVLSQCYK